MGTKIRILKKFSAMESEMIRKAREVAGHSHAPYSGFPVGCAIADQDGKIYTGCNVENASFGLSVCAERNAIFHAVSVMDKKLQIRTVIIYTPTPSPTPPCGACRQVISEFAENPVIISVCDGRDIITGSLNDMFTHPFNLKP